jgi:RNA-directed DNA polymerase
MGILRRLIDALLGRSGEAGPREGPAPDRAPAAAGGPEAAPPARAAIHRLLGVRRKRLAWLAFHKPDAYAEVRIPKRGGGERVLHAPCAALKFVQRRILRRVLDPVVLHRCCHGFHPGRSIVTNARPHVGREMVVGLDLRDFFPTITFARVFGLFRSFGFGTGEAGLLARLTTWQGRLPQGSPASPAIANLVCRTLDRRLAGLAEARGAVYTRYADDLAFSGPPAVLGILPIVRRIVAEEGFGVAEEKTRIMRRGSRQKVCGVVVNRRAALPRESRRRIRAILHRASQPAARRKGPAASDASLQGYRSLLRMFEEGR